MAIFGALEDLSLTEIIPTLNRRKGRLLISNFLDKSQTEIHLNSSVVTAILLNNKPLDLIDAHQFFTHLIGNRSGNFEFVNEKSENLIRHFEIHVSQLLTGQMETPEDNSLNTSNYPDSRTRFVATNQNQNVYLGFQLDEFWNKSFSFLLSGANAEELSQQFQIPLLQAQAYLYHLRIHGRIQPLRAFARAVNPQIPTLTNQRTTFNAQELQSNQPQKAVNPVLEKPKSTIGLLAKLINALGFRK